MHKCVRETSLTKLCAGCPDPVHLSSLKQLALSPMHYKHMVEVGLAASRHMRVGTIVHHLVLGPRNRKPLTCYMGDVRRGREWEAFERAHRGYEIMTNAEWADAEPIAAAVLRDDIAHSLIKADGVRTEVPLTWQDGPVSRATDGLDIVGPGYIADLKVTSSSEPEAFSRQATRLLYYAQMADYRRAALANGIDVSKGVYLIAVESDPPYPVTTFRLTEPTLLQGEKSLTMWLEKLRSCQENDHWPGYTQTVVDYDLPPWFGAADQEDV